MGKIKKIENKEYSKEVLDKMNEIIEALNKLIPEKSFNTYDLSTMKRIKRK